MSNATFILLVGIAAIPFFFGLRVGEPEIGALMTLPIVVFFGFETGNTVFAVFSLLTMLAVAAAAAPRFVRPLTGGNDGR
jgi:hypothetical protein